MRSTPIVLGLAWLGLAGAGLVVGCEARVSLGGRCTLEADCASELACVGGRCREECTEARDCAAGLRCLAGASGLRACSLAPEETCSDTDPCDDMLFAECRIGRCVTGCVDERDCVAGSCDRSGAVGVCIEPVSVGDADAGPIDAGTEDDAGADAGRDCLPESEDSARTVARAVLGVDGTVDRGDPAWLETLGAEAIAIDDAASASFAIGMRLEGPSSPEVLAAVTGSGGALTLRRGQPLVDNLHLTVSDDGALAAEIGFTSVATRSSATAINFVGLRSRPSGELDAFAWVYRQDTSPQPLAPRRPPPIGTYPGGAALFLGPLDEELFAVRFWPPTDVGGRLGIVASGLGVDNATDLALPMGWADRPVSLATAPSLVLVHEAVTRETRLIRVVRIETAPMLDDDELALVSDGAPALAATATPTEHRVLAIDTECGLLPVHGLLCDPAGSEDCTLEAATVGLVAPSPSRVQASAFGRSIAVLVDDATGARLIVLDEDGLIVDLMGPVLLPREVMDAGGAMLRLARTSLGATAASSSAIVAIGGLYMDAAGRAARVRVAALGVTVP